MVLFVIDKLFLCVCVCVCTGYRQSWAGPFEKAHSKCQCKTV
uniref:Uncharacterized protein n=1 Tax=Anguilla anguilla TaxID=7936 RepID=A0A0E9WLC5_ANGAN